MFAGQQLLGPEWGLCTRVSSSNNFYASLLYDNHDETDNLYTYNWMPASHPVIGKTALGTINPNTWYRMTVKVHDDSIITSINGIAKLKLQNSQHTSGGVAFFGESGTKAQLNDLHVRKYTAIEPTVSVGDENQVAQSLSLKALLEGPFDGIEMNTNLNDYGILSLIQPYNTDPWNYTGTESVSEIPNPNVVDWVLVEIRDAEEAASATTATRVARQAALLLKDGRIVGLDGISNIQFNTPIIHQLFVVIWHRNHLGIISANSLIPGPGGLYSYDFTSTISQAYGDGQINLGNSFFGMIAGDANADGLINLSDGIQTWIPQAGTTGYLNGDLNLNAQVNNPDKNDQWLKNLTMESQIPE